MYVCIQRHKNSVSLGDSFCIHGHREAGSCFKCPHSTSVFQTSRSQVLAYLFDSTWQAFMQDFLLGMEKDIACSHTLRLLLVLGPLCLLKLLTFTSFFLCRATVELPLHFRYQAPSDSLYKVVPVPAPRVLVQCRHQQDEIGKGY